MSGNARHKRAQLMKSQLCGFVSDCMKIYEFITEEGRRPETTSERPSWHDLDVCDALFGCLSDISTNIANLKLKLKNNLPEGFQK